MVRQPFSSLSVLVVAFLAVAIVPRTTGHADDGPSQRPNILFLLSDDQRPDTIHALGNPHIRTPHFDALARRGVSLRRAVCANPICTPSRGEILTGCSGFRSGVLNFGRQLDPALVTWPQALRQAGYATWFVGKWHNDGRPIERGFCETRGLFAGGGGRWWQDQVDWKGTPVTGYRGWIFQDDAGQKFPERGVGLTPDISRQFADAAIERIEHAGENPDEQPWFLQVAFTAPHDPLLMPPGWEHAYAADELPLPPNFLDEHPFDHGNFSGRDEMLLPWPRTPKMIRDLLRVYYAVINDLDAQVGRILAALDATGQARDTIVIFTSDHGLGVGSHGIRGKQNMYEHTIGVPLIIAGPGIVGGRQSDAQIYLRELYPTICELAGAKVPDTVEGESFADLLRGRSYHGHPDVFCYFRDKQRMIRGDRWKVIYYPHLDRWQLFDLQSDPYELQDLAGASEHAATLHRHQQRLRTVMAEMHDPLAHQAPPAENDDSDPPDR